MGSPLDGNNDMERLQTLSSRIYSDQAKFFLNHFWNTFGENEADNVWNYTQKMEELDEKSGKKGNELGEMIAHRFLEQFGETLTVRQLREVLRDIDIDTNKKVSLSEYLLFKFKVDWHELVNSVQGDQAQIAQAEKMLEEVQAALALAQEKNSSAKVAEDAAFSAEKTFKHAQEEVEATLAELKNQEDTYAAKLADLEARSSSGGIVSRNKAKNEREQLLQEDPLPLTRAKISSEAALRKVEKARAPFKATREAAVLVREEADAALDAADDAFKKAADFLDEVKRTSQAKGSVWWLERELQEAKKYLPQSRGGTR
uniref:TolA-like protein n=1 Tax=Hirondellea gigas TaxID=1518452 RepID=A0A2R5L0R6_9CRUS